MPSIFDPHTPVLPEHGNDTRTRWWQLQLQSGGAPRIPGIVFLVVATLVLLWGVSGWAQTMYRSTMPDGRVIFGDKPASGAERVETINPSSRPANTAPLGSMNEEAAQQNELRRQQLEAQRQQLELQRQQRAAHQREVREAEEALRAAKAAQAAGKEPLPGERRGNVNGTSRLTEEYWARQNALKADVAKARKRLNALRAGR
jgi:hypothetical protein